MRRVSGSEPHDSNSSLHHLKKRKLKEVDVAMSKKLNTSDNDMCTIDKLSDDLLIDVLSRLSIKEAARASVISRRWRNLWKYTHGTLEFDARSNCKRIETNITKFKSSVDNVVKVHKGSKIDAFIVRFDLRSQVKCHAVDRWIHFAMRKQPKVFELRLDLGVYSRSHYVFPNMEELSLHSHDFTSLSNNSLTTLRLIGLDITDNVVRWFLSSCPNLEHLCISESRTTKNVQIVDPLPKLKSLEISECSQIESMVSHYDWVTVSDAFPQLHSLEHLEVKTTSEIGCSLHFFTWLIKTSPLLQEFRIKIDYELDKRPYQRTGSAPFPKLGSVVKFSHLSLKMVEIAGFFGCASEKKFLSKLCRRAPFLERVVIDTTCRYFFEETRKFRVMPGNGKANPRVDAKEFAEKMRCMFPPSVKLVVI